MALPDRCLSIRQPWAHFIVNGGKRIENRSWKANYRGPIFIHASKGLTRDEYIDACEFYFDEISLDGLRPSWWQRFSDLPRGGIVGIADVVDCVPRSHDPWFCGPWGFVLDNVRSTPFIPCKGALGFFRRPEGIEHALNR